MANLYELEISPIPEKIIDLDLDAVGRATNLVIEAKERDFLQQRNAIKRLANVIVQTPGGVEIFSAIQK